VLADYIPKAYQVRGEKYLYTTHLMALDTCKPIDGESSTATRNK